MKLALCMAGHMRSFRETYPYLEQVILRRYSPDIFLTSWEEEDPAIINEALDLYKPVASRVFDYKEYVDAFEHITAQANRIGFKRVHVNEATPIKEDTDGIIGYPGYKNLKDDSDKFPLWVPVISQFFQVQSCLQLMHQYSTENNMQYDLVFKVRPDLLFFHDITLYASNGLAAFAQSFDYEKNQVEFLPKAQDELYSVLLNKINGTEYKTLNDYFYYGSQPVMTKLMSVYDEYYDTIQGMKKNEVPVALQGINESILYYYLKTKDIRVVTAGGNKPDNLYSLILRKDHSVT